MSASISPPFDPQQKIHKLDEKIQALKAENEALELKEIPALEAELKALAKHKKDAWFWNKADYQGEIDMTTQMLSYRRQQIQVNVERIKSNQHRVGILESKVEPEPYQGPLWPYLWSRRISFVEKAIPMFLSSVALQAAGYSFREAYVGGVVIGKFWNVLKKQNKTTSKQSSSGI